MVEMRLLTAGGGPPSAACLRVSALFLAPLCHLRAGAVCSRSRLTQCEDRASLGRPSQGLPMWKRLPHICPSFRSASPIQGASTDVRVEAPEPAREEVWRDQNLLASAG